MHHIYLPDTQIFNLLNLLKTVKIKGQYLSLTCILPKVFVR